MLYSESNAILLQNQMQQTSDVLRSLRATVCLKYKKSKIKSKKKKNDQKDYSGVGATDPRMRCLPAFASIHGSNLLIIVTIKSYKVTM